VALLALAFAIPAAPRACVGPREADLWTLVREAQAIVVVEATRVSPSPWTALLNGAAQALEAGKERLREIWWDGFLLVDGVVDGLWVEPSYRVTVEVLETLSGSAPARLVLPVEYVPVVPGGPVVLFLDRSGFGWEIPWVSNAAIHVRDPGELEDLRVVLASAAALRAGSETAPARWHVMAGALPGTRDHVVRALAARPPAPQRQRFLAKSLERHPPTENLSRWLLALGDGADGTVLREMAAVISVRFERGNARRDDEGAAEEILRRLGEPAPPEPEGCGLARGDALRARWSDAIARHFPDLDPAPARLRIEALDAESEDLLRRFRAAYARPGV
jgi:hypothetical protein